MINPIQFGKMLKLTVVLSLFSCVCAFAQRPTNIGVQEKEDEFVPLFDGKSLDGWTPSKENPNSFSVNNGLLIVKGGRSHLFYTGSVNGGDFKNFELKLKIRTTEGSNSGVYFQTNYQDEGWPDKGFEAQVNSTHTDPKKTGSLYGIVNMFVPEDGKQTFITQSTVNQEMHVYQPTAPSKDGEWFDYHIIVRNSRITIKLNEKTLVDWVQPKCWMNNIGGPKGRAIDHGTFALQAHDPDSEVHYKDIMVKVLD